MWWAQGLCVYHSKNVSQTITADHVWQLLNFPVSYYNVASSYNGSVWTAPFGLWGLAHSSFGWSAAAATTVLGVLGTGLAFALMGTLVSRVGGPRASFITYLIPVVSLALGTVFRDDHVRPLALVGVVLVLTGAVLASRREH